MIKVKLKKKLNTEIMECGFKQRSIFWYKNFAPRGETQVTGHVRGVGGLAIIILCT